MVPDDTVPDSVRTGGPDRPQVAPDPGCFDKRTMARVLRQSVLAAPRTSPWLRQALQSTQDTEDPLQAVRDAEMLCHVLQAELEALTDRSMREDRIGRPGRSRRASRVGQGDPDLGSLP